MLKNRVLSCLLALCMLCSLLPATALATEDGATAELADPVGIEFSNASSPYSGNYFISTKKSLEALSTAVNSGNTMQGIKFYLQNDIILNDGHFSAKEGSLYYTPDQSDTAYQVSIENATYGDSEQLTAFVPIGFQAKTDDAQWEKNGFAGEFYGNNHEIKGLFVNGNHANAEAHYKGLFGALLTGGNISDLAVSGCVYGAGSNSGGIVGKSWGCIDNCHFSGVVMGAYNAGGIVGETASTGAANTLQNCTNTAHISEGSTATNGGNWGGIAGCANGVSIQNCINYGAVTSSKYANVGGIIGVGNADISACINWGSITGPESRTTNGGVAGNHNTGTTEQNFICITTTDELTKYTKTTRPNHAKCAVALYLNGGSFDGGIVVSSGALATPTKESQIFDGWYVNSDLSGEAAATLETEKIYYAKWIPDSGSCGAEGNGENVTWKLEQNISDSNNPTTYTLTISGSGAMCGWADTDRGNRPWNDLTNSITQVIVEAGVTTIGQNAFYGLSQLGNVQLNEELTTIARNAFRRCTSLKSFSIPNSVTSMGYNVLAECSQIETLKIGTGLTKLGDGCFLDCGQGQSATPNIHLKSVIIPANITEISGGSFRNCTDAILTVLGPDVSATGNPCGISGVAVVNATACTSFEISNQAPGSALVYVQTRNVVSYTPPQYNNNLKFAVTNGGTFAEGTTFTSETLAIPTKEGHIFGGWYETERFTDAAVTTATAGKTYYAKWIELKTDKVSLEYGSTQTFPTIEGVTLSNWESSDPTIVSIENNQLKANKVGQTTLTATARTTADGTGTLTVNVEVTPMRITYGSPDKTNNEDGRPYIVYALKADGTTPTFSELLGFYPVKAGNQEGTFEPDTGENNSKAITLIPGTDVEYIYVNDTSGNKITTDTLPTHPTLGENGNPHSIPVELKLKNPNYRFCTVGTHWEAKDTIILYVTCYEEGMNEVDLYLEGDNTPLETFDDRHEYEYTGEGIVPTERDLTSLYTKGTNTEDSITAFTAHFHAVEEGAAFAGSHLTQVANTALNAEALKAIAPTEPGVYSFVINGYNKVAKTYCYASRRYSIVKGNPKGEPTFDKVSSGVTLSTVTLSGEMKNAAGTAVAGSFAWENDNQTVERGKSYTWTFTPDDTDHYNTVTDTAVVWPASSGGSGSSSSNTTTKTVTNADGTVTTIVTNKRTGTVTETTKYKDGSTLVVETKKDGTVTTTETRTDGVRVKTVDAPEKDVTVSVTIPKSVGTTTILGRTDMDYGMVAVDAKTGEVVKLSFPTEDGMLVKVAGSTELTLVDNAREFSDTNGHWAENAIDFATAHEMFAGTSETTFSPDDTMTRAMLMTVLARFDGEDTAGGSVWYEKGMAWAVANGVSDGSYPEDSISREQLATMLWRYAGSPTVSGMALSEFSDHDSVSEYAVDAMRWAVSEGLIVGVEHDVLAPRSTATRAQVATILMRFVEMLTK